MQRCSPLVKSVAMLVDLSSARVSQRIELLSADISKGMMLGSMRQMQQQLDEARDTFAKMPEPERSEYVETMAAEFRGWDKDNKQALLEMVESNFLGMPDTMKTQLLARLKQAR